MITLTEVEEIHKILIKDFGGGSGIRDLGELQSAIARPYATFAETDLYPTAIEKAAAILESILINHPFVDGNKRTGYVLMRMMLLVHGLDIFAAMEEKYVLVINTSTGEFRFDEIKSWLSGFVK